MKTDFDFKVRRWTWAEIQGEEKKTICNHFLSAAVKMEQYSHASSLRMFN